MTAKNEGVEGRQEQRFYSPGYNNTGAVFYILFGEQQNFFLRDL
jgi:hypothetical protein